MNWKKSSISVITTLFLLLTLNSCDALLNVKTPETWEDVYNVLFDSYVEGYAYIEEAPLTVEELRKKYSGRAAALKKGSEGKTELAKLFQEFERDVKDEHFWIETLTVPLPLTDEQREENTKNRNRKQRPYYTGYVEVLGQPFGFLYGFIKNHPDIGYILVKELNSGLGGLERLKGNKWAYKIDSIIKTLKARGVKKMILDMRSEAGGSQYTPGVIVSRFLTKRKLYMYSYDLYGSANKASSYKKESHYLDPGGERFTGSVVVLANRLTASGGEIFVLMARQIDGVKIIGTNTAGLPGSITIYDLPVSGWEYELTTSRTTGLDGKSFLRVGLSPDIFQEDPVGGTVITDSILEKGIQVLNEG